MGKTFCIGDIHGRIEALKEVLAKSKFDMKKDKLICLGDVCDGDVAVRECFDLLLKIKNLVYVLGNHDCLDEKTEVLTKRGWLKYTELINTDEIYSYDIKNKKGVWSKYNSIIIKPYKGEMIRVIGNQFDMKTTPTHRVLHIKNNKEENKKIEYCLAKDLKGSIDIICSASDNCQEYFIKDGMLKICAWILTDGSIAKNPNHNSKIIYQSKYIQEIRELLNNENIKFTEKKNKIKKKGTKVAGRCLVNDSKPSVNFFIKAVSGKNIPVYRKDILPEWTFMLSDRQFKIFIDTLIKGDGTFCNKNSIVLYGRKEFLESVQSLCAIKGYRAYLGYCLSGNYYRLNITRKDTYAFQTSEKNKKSLMQKEHYDGIVWCLNVPYSNFMVRRKGKCYFTGNCWFLEWVARDKSEKLNMLWWNQGGMHTAAGYGFRTKNVPISHIQLLKKAKLYHYEDKMAFVHGGFDPLQPLDWQDEEKFLWDREIIDYAMRQKIPGYSSVFIGHTTTQLVVKDTEKPLFFNNLILVDTGAGWTGKLTIMDIHTKEYWQSKKQTPGPSKSKIKGLYFKEKGVPLSNKEVHKK